MLPADQRLEADDPVGPRGRRSAGSGARSSSRSSARRRSLSRSSRSSVCGAHRRVEQREAPGRVALARTIATSASRSSSSGVDRGRARRARCRCEALMNQSRPLERERRAQLGRRSARRSAGASPSSATGSRRIPNSSPPKRATVSPGRRQRREPLPDRDQQPVAHRVADALVDDLEPVEVEHDHGDRARRRPGGRATRAWAIRSVSSSRFGRPVVGSYRAPRSATSTRRALSMAIDASWAKRVRAVDVALAERAVGRARREPDDADDLVAREERHADDRAEQSRSGRSRPAAPRRRSRRR